MKDGVYSTKAGSTFTIKGSSYDGYFDAFEEPNACCDCQFSDIDMSEIEPTISWSCDYCGGGNAELFLQENNEK
jgi:hypothetical protein